MADWRNISDTEVDPDAPVTSELAYAFRDNPVAIAEGAVGAPLIGGGMAKVQVSLEIGSYLFAIRNPGGSFTQNSVTRGSVYPGSELFPAAALNSISITAGGGTGTVSSGQGGSLSGSWRACGTVGASNAGALNTGGGSTLFQRVA